MPKEKVGPSASVARTAASIDASQIPSEGRARVRQVFVTDDLGETTCSETDFGDTVRDRFVASAREVYSFPKMNALLGKHPEFAAAIGLTAVHDCNDARRYGERYRAYSQTHPAFDHEGPTKEEWFREFLSDPANVAKPGSGSR